MYSLDPFKKEELRKRAQREIYRWATSRPPVKKQLGSVAKRMALILIATLVMVIVLFFYKAGKARAESVIYKDDPAQGYLFYKDPPEEKQEEVGPPLQSPPKEEPPKAEKPPEAEKNTSADNYEYPIDPNANIPPVMRQWLLHPTPESAEDYLAWQAKHYQHLGALGYSLREAYLRRGPEIYPLQGYPEGPLASQYWYRELPDIKRDILARVGNEHQLGLIYFYRKSCQTCRQQSDIISSLIAKYGLSVRGVTDSDVDVDYSLPFASAVNPGLFSQYGVSQIPTVIAVLEKDGGAAFAPISAGFTGSDWIEQQLLRFLINEGVVQERQLNPNLTGVKIN